MPINGADTPWDGRESRDTQAVVRGKRILLVEDQQLVRAALRMMLELDGHQVTEAGNGAEALRLFTLGEFDLVVTDFEMPVMAGNQLAAGIKRLAPSLPILMVTASEGARCGAENPVDALLDKPLTVSDLRCALGKLFSALPAAAQPRAGTQSIAMETEFAPRRSALVCPECVPAAGDLAPCPE